MPNKVGIIKQMIDIELIYTAAAVKKDKKNNVLDSRKTYNICKCTEYIFYTADFPSMY